MVGTEGKIEVTNTPQEAQLFSSHNLQGSGGNMVGTDGAAKASPQGAVRVAKEMASTGPAAA
ncbi:hypothetical protein DD569_28415, partial [Klebsiella pneumoniae]